VPEDSDTLAAAIAAHFAQYPKVAFAMAELLERAGSSVDEFTYLVARRRPGVDTKRPAAPPWSGRDREGS
jgi:hypothetical protein